MKKYDQLISGGKGTESDCMRACVATIIQQPIEDLPNWHDANWFIKWETWFAERGKVFDIEYSGYDQRGLWIASVKSQNYAGSTHAVVMKDGKLFHDPSPVKKFKSIPASKILYKLTVEDTVSVQGRSEDATQGEHNA